MGLDWIKGAIAAEVGAWDVDVDVDVAVAETETPGDRLQSMYVHLNCQLRSVLVGNWAHNRDCQHRDLV